MAFVLGAMNHLEVCAADISTAFLCWTTREKVHVIAGPEFGKHAGKQMITEKGLHGLKSSSTRFHEHLSAHLRKMGFVPSKADFDLWMRPKDDHCECVSTCVDDVLAFSHDRMAAIKEIQDTHELKGISKPEHCLGGNYHTIDGLVPKEVDRLRDVDHEEKEH